MKYPNLEKALTDLGWFLLINEDGNYREVREILDPENVDAEGTPKITACQKSVLVLDNSEWNETYLIDVVSERLKTLYPEMKPGSFDLHYCNDVCNRSYIELRKKLAKDYFLKEDKKQFEKDTLHPMVIVINPLQNCIVAIKEPQIAKLSEKEIDSVLMFLNDDFCQKNKEG